jgi:ribosome-binding protein aMBF1 (putative translation factor)
MRNKTYISSMELGKVIMGIEVAHALACALDVKLGELLCKAEQARAASHSGDDIEATYGTACQRPFL